MQQDSVLLRSTHARHATCSTLYILRNPLGVGSGLQYFCTPYSATMKKCVARMEGLGVRPESSPTGPAEKHPPRLRLEVAARRSLAPEATVFTSVSVDQPLSLSQLQVRKD